MEPNKPTFHPPPQATLHEIRTAKNTFAYLLPKFHSLEESNPHLKILDVGCGSGSITTSFAKLLPSGHITGIDANVSILPRAQALASAAGISNAEFQEGSVYAIPFPDETFDVTYCHQVLIHIPNPWDALREMLRVTKPGGIVAAREGDYETECIWPESPGLAKFHALMGGLMRAVGGSPTAGRQLVSWAMKAGVERGQITLSNSTQLYAMPSDRKMCSQGLCDQLRTGGLRQKALKFGLGSEEEFEEMAEAWEEWQEREDGSLAMLHGEILVQK